jgi:NAD(P)-dependent dehydrogenase (short-subunit alcohol dehydrogenase family)
MTKTLITGSNKGLGREAARRLLADGHDVWMAARTPVVEVTADDMRRVYETNDKRGRVPW